MKRPVVAAALSWGMGLVLSGAQAGRMIHVSAAFAAAIVYAIVVIHIVRKNSGNSIAYMLLPVLFLLGMFHAHAQGRLLYEAGVRLEQAVSCIENGVTKMSGRVIRKERKEKEDSVTFVLTLNSVSVNGMDLEGEALVYTTADVKSGSVVTFEGEAEVYERAKNPGGFDAFSYYGYRGIYYHIYDGKILRRTESNNVSDRLKDGVFTFRTWMLEAIRMTAPEDVYGFFQGILLGEKSSMDEEERETLRRSGLAHILTVSGLHISMLASMLLLLLRKLRISFYLRLFLGMIVIGLYVVLTGAGYPALRAYDMFLIASFGRSIGRTYDGKCALSVCFLWRTFQKPMLVFDSGFQLSFLSMAAILWLVPHVQTLWIRNKAESKRLRSRIRSALLASWTVLTVISPVICYSYFETSRYAMLLNLLVLPLISLLLISLLAGSALMILPAFLGFSLFRPALGPAVSIARSILWLSERFERIPGNVCITGRPKAEEILLYSVFFGGGLILLCLTSRLTHYGRKKSRVTGRNYLPDQRRSRVPLFLLLMLSGLLIPNALKRRPPAVTELIMLDVGQGDGFIFRFPNGENMVIDCGNSFRDDLWKRVIEPAFLYYGMDTIDAWMLTHFDMDHISAFVQMEQEIAAEENALSAFAPHIRCRRLLISSADTIEELTELSGRKPDCEVYALYAGMEFTVGGARVVSLLPDPAYPASTENDASIVIRIETNDHFLLFAADMSQEQEEWLLARKSELAAEILKVAHHGSLHSSSDEFLAAVKPKIALISVGKNNYGHPAPEVLSRLKMLGSEIRMTNRKGAVLVRLGTKTFTESYLP
ncbi:MAG: ComEC/Rec2 family competence protein [Lachnospiraceae bacterium]|nr:ComEC/Rec2 family competence protein [Lachnospiraceae bacterium]